MTKGQEQVAEARAIAMELADTLAGSGDGLDERVRALTTGLDEIAGHVFVKGALAVPFTAAVARAARAAREAYPAGDAAAGAKPIETLEAAVVKLQQKTTGTGGVAIT
jgi:hypothetical protein